MLQEKEETGFPEINAQGMWNFFLHTDYMLVPFPETLFSFNYSGTIAIPRRPSLKESFS